MGELAFFTAWPEDRAQIVESLVIRATARGHLASKGPHRVGLKRVDDVVEAG